VASEYVQHLLTRITDFVSGDSARGLIMIISGLIAFLWANSPWAYAYIALSETHLGLGFGEWRVEESLVDWVNDGLMAVFFFMVGLEIKREFLAGQLSSPRDASLAVFAAIGGMAVPIACYLLINWGSEGMSGWGVPMATDAAFALSVIALLGSRAPASLKVVLTALAVVDDAIAITVIAVFYAKGLDPLSLSLSLGVVAAAFAYGRLIGGRSILLLALFGVIAWFFMLHSGVHATIAGVLMALVTPMGRGDQQEQSAESGPLHRLEHALDPWVAYLILPVFALLNAGVSLAGGGGLFTPVALGVIVGLVLGKPVGVLGLSFLATRLGWASLPEGVGWGSMAGLGLLAGIGFTVSLFISTLAFQGGDLIDQAKLGTLTGSVVAAGLGLALLLLRAR
jgi:NhaA family Na+:H+ antiporter